MDFTKEIRLNEKERRIYKILQALLFLLAFVVSFYVAFRILFPTQYFAFDFANPDSTKNTVLRPRAANGNIINHGRVQSDLYFDTALVGNYSFVEVSFDLNKKSSLPESGDVEIQRSYQAFLYTKSDTSELPTKQEETASYPSGSLISYADSVYVVSGKIIYPIDSVATFEAMGYSWDDVIPASSDEISSFEKGKLLTLFSVHPDGTIFKDIANENYYFIIDGKKIFLSEKNLVDYARKTKPILASSFEASVVEKCESKKSFWNKRRYICEIPVEKMQKLIGKDYEFKTVFGSDVKIDTITVKFKQNINLSNLKLTASLILNRIKNNYASQQ